MAMSKLPLVSVVVPFYNPGAYFEQCLRSVLQQAPVPVELIAVDDGSTDGSLELAQSLFRSPEFQDPLEGRVRLLANNENCGAFETINRGLALVSGDFINILNHDDLFSPGRLPRLIALLPSLKGSDLLWGFSRVKVIDGTGAPVSRSSVEGSYFESIQDAVQCFPTVGFSLLAHNSSISTGNILASRGLFDLLGGFAPLHYCHDWDFVLRALLHAEPVYLTDTGYEYRLHQTNTFRRLSSSVRDAEAAAVQRGYLRAVATGNFKNLLAPGPATWPGVFESAIEMFGMKDTWRTARWA
jgi:glycosyltransferase involved in cell wall biosynthesis